ncbi:PorP/SprF family type IX secretion system membrane protein [Mesonia aquimarina]|uniref:PorP/SprF family type IX secretion system membrane protein n=1 Tax=Mesonia aquimarina TaxID=1504967 RepID=UPI000EF5B6AA|nr:type IX secretion system membrane protein PorP/SprF [Mesonia aquimarina]
MTKHIKNSIAILTLFLVAKVFGQQEPQYTQYMYNNMSVNSAYAGSLGHLAITGIYRSQWVGLDGAPKTQTLGIDSPIGKNVGLGLSLVNDQIGPSNEFYTTVNFSYTIKASETHDLSFGIAGGGKFLDIDWSKGSNKDPDIEFQENVNKFLPSVGAGVYLHGQKSYIGVSIPNFFTDQKYDDIESTVADERLHIYIIGGLVFDLSENTKLKPAFLMKNVSGAPLVVDFSANFLFYEAFTLGVSYRTGDSVSGLAAFQVTNQILVGYSYDYTTSALEEFNSGTHEIMLRFELKSSENGVKSPRFF